MGQKFKYKTLTVIYATRLTFLYEILYGLTPRSSVLRRIRFLIIDLLGVAFKIFFALEL